MRSDGATVSASQCAIRPAMPGRNIAGLRQRRDQGGGFYGGNHPYIVPNKTWNTEVVMLTDAETNEWMDGYIWPHVIELLLNDAYFKLVRHVSQQTGKYIDPLGFLVINGYITFQLMGIRRLCDNRRDTISMRRLLVETNVAEKPKLLAQLDACNEICDRASDHIAHTGNPSRRPRFGDWHLTETDLTNAHQAICKVTMALDRCRSKPRNYVKIFPSVSLDMQQFNLSAAETQKLWDFWHANADPVNSWVYKS
jgi:hypothetical protein